MVWEKVKKMVCEGKEKPDREKRETKKQGESRAADREPKELIYGPFLPEDSEFDDIETEERGKRQHRYPTVFTRILVMEAGVAVLALAVMLLVLTNVLGAESAARRYAKARSDGDWNTLYEMMEYDDMHDGFSGKRAFVTAMTVSGGGEAGDLKEVRKIKKQGKKVSFCIRYRKNKEEFKEEIELVRKGLLWKVEDKGLQIRKVAIRVPVDAKLKLDTVDVSKKIKPTRTETGDIYNVPSMFGYTHYVEVKREGVEDVQKIVNLSERGYDEGRNPIGIVTDANISAELLQQASDQAIREFQAIMEGSIHGEKAEKIEALQKADAGCKKKVHKKYRIFRDYVLGGNGKRAKGLELVLSHGKAAAQAEAIGKKGANIVRINLSGDYDCHFNKGKKTSGRKGRYTAVMWYIQAKEGWKIYDMVFPDL